MKVFVVIENSWDGRNYSFDGVSVFRTMEKAEKYKNDTYNNVNLKYRADFSYQIEEAELED